MSWADFALVPDAIYVRFWVCLAGQRVLRVQRLALGWVH